MDWGFVTKTWDKWAASNVGSSGQPLRAALLLNYDPTGPSRLLSTILKCEGMKADPIQFGQFVDFVNHGKLQMETFFIGPNEFTFEVKMGNDTAKIMMLERDMITSIHENWFSARSMDTSSSVGEGAIVMQTTAFILVALYTGSTGAASRAVVAADQFTVQLSRRNL